MYAEAVSWLCKVAFNHRKNMLINISLKVTAKSLPHTSLYRVHRSYIVNLEHIELIDDDTIIMKNTIPIWQNL